MAEWNRICCAVDFSPTSRLALEQAAALARRHDAELTVAHATGLSPTEDFTAIERELEQWRQEAERLAGRAVERVLLLGAPAAEVAQLVRDRRVDLLVIGTHGRTGLRRAVLGSVAEQLIRMVSCPVLVLPLREA